MKLLRKVHKWFGLILVLPVIIYAITCIFLGHRDQIRELNKVDNKKPPVVYNLPYSQAIISIDDAINLAYKDLGKKGKIDRIEMRYDQGTLIYRIRFKEEKPEQETTINALNSEILISAHKQEVKVFMEMIHSYYFVPELVTIIIGHIWAILMFLICITGLIMYIKTRKGNLSLKFTNTRMWHRNIAILACVPLFISALTGILLLDPEDAWLKSISDWKVSNTTEKPDADFKYNSLPISVEKAIEIYQNQFDKPKELRRSILKYQYGTMAYAVASQERMRQETIINAYTGEIIKPYSKITLRELNKIFHQFYFFGKSTKYIVDVFDLCLIIMSVSGLLLFKLKKKTTV